MRSGNPPNRNILVGGGGETNRDFLSRGDPKGKSLNRMLQRRVGADVGFWIRPLSPWRSRSALESSAVEGDSPVDVCQEGMGRSPDYYALGLA